MLRTKKPNPPGVLNQDNGKFSGLLDNAIGRHLAEGQLQSPLPRLKDYWMASKSPLDPSVVSETMETAEELKFQECSCRGGVDN